MAEAVDLLALPALVDWFWFRLFLLFFLLFFLLRGVTRVRLSRGRVDVCVSSVHVTPSTRPCLLDSVMRLLPHRHAIAAP